MNWIFLKWVAFLFKEMTCSIQESNLVPLDLQAGVLNDKTNTPYRANVI